MNMSTTPSPAGRVERRLADLRRLGAGAAFIGNHGFDAYASDSMGRLDGRGAAA